MGRGDLCSPLWSLQPLQRFKGGKRNPWLRSEDEVSVPYRKQMRLCTQQRDFLTRLGRALSCSLQLSCLLL